MSGDVGSDLLEMIVQLKNLFEKRVSYLEEKSRSQEEKIEKLTTELENIKSVINYQETTLNHRDSEELLDFLYPDINLNESIKKESDQNDNQQEFQNNQYIKVPPNVDVDDIFSRNLVVELGVRCISTSPNILKSSTETEIVHDFICAQDKDQTTEFIILKEKETFQRNTNLKSLSKSKLFNNRLPNKKDKKFYTCPDCSMSFKKFCDFKRHSKTNHYPCSFCSQKFVYMILLKQHELTHKMNQIQSLKIEDQTENDGQTSQEPVWEFGTVEKPYKCTICAKSFKKRGDLKVHRRSHTGERRPYSCTVCSKSFIKSSDLVRHIRIHTGEKPFECLTCQKKFTQIATLRRHQVTHKENLDSFRLQISSIENSVDK